MFFPTHGSITPDLKTLRAAMLAEAWHASIKYIAEIKSDRDLEHDPILTCIPGAIRWTIHPKPGQLAFLIPTALGDPVFPWHGVSLFKLTNKNKIKQYNLPTITVESLKAKPVLMRHNDACQPLFYIDESISDIAEFLTLLAHNFSRTRKS